MATTVASAIVLDSTEYGDCDRIVTVFSQNLGKFSFLARGVNKLVSKNKYSLETFNHSNFEFFKTTKIDGLSKLKTGTIIKSYSFITEHYYIYQYASAINYIIQNGLDSWKPKTELYENLLLVLDNFNDNQEILKNFVYFLFYSLPTFGGPVINPNCFRCDLKASNYEIYHLHDLHLICHNCILENEKAQDQDWVNFVQFLINHKLAEALDFPVNEQYVIILGKILLSYYREILGLDGKSLHLIDQKPIFNSITNDLINFLLQY